MELTKTIWSHGQLSYKARKKHCKVSYLKGKANKKGTHGGSSPEVII